MKLGIIGLPQTGKKTLYRLLTGADAAITAGRATEGIAEVRDGRFDDLAALYNPKKATRARITVELLPDIDEAVIRDGAVFRNIADTDALCHAVRAFTDESVYHVKGSADAGRDIAMINAELIMHDLIFTEKRLERISLSLKKKQEDSLKTEEELMLRIKAHLEADRPLRTMEFTAEDAKIIASYPLITCKAMIVAVNVDDGELKKGTLLKKLREQFAGQDMKMMQISARLEAEIDALESADDRAMFMEESGITEPAVSLLSRLCLEALGYISFFTVGEDEVRQWQIRRGSLAPEAGKAIHSDIQRGFIRAEVMKYADLIQLRDEEAVKKSGKMHLSGKDYLVEDGDIINFRFNV